MCNCENNEEINTNPGAREFGVVDKLKSVANGISGNIKREFVENDVYLQRLAKCRPCGNRVNFIKGEVNPNRVEKADQCSLCGCFLKTDLGFAKGKAWLQNQSCPLGKWEK